MTNKKVVKIKIRLTEEMLGSQPSDEEIFRKFIASKAPDATGIEDEVEKLGVDEVVEKGKTIFPKDETGNPLLLSHQVKGFCKAAWKALWKIKGTKSSGLKAGVSKIDRGLFVKAEDGSKFIPFACEKDTDLQRPLRAETAQGPRVSLACSERIKAGAEATFFIEIIDDTLEAPLREWMAYGQYSGLGQWRNSGRGTFEVLSYETEEKPMFPELEEAS